MNKLMTTGTVARVLAVIVATVLVLIPFHAFLTVWLASGVGHYTALRLWKEVFLGLGLGLAAILVWRNRSLRLSIGRSWLWRVAAAYLAVQATWGAVALLLGEVSLQAGLEGLIIDSRLVLFLFVVFVAGSTAEWLWRWRFRLLLGPAAIVVLFGLLQQFVLPYDVLRHFGYGPDTIRPYQTIDKKVSYIRVLSTLRGANPLGAYLLVVLATLAGRGRWAARLFSSVLPWLAGIFATAVVLYGSRSRSAWIGALVALVTVLALQLPRRHAKRLVIALVAIMAVGCLVLVALRNNDFVQNTFFHTDETSKAASSSNSDHWSASYGALKQVMREPLGRGPGSAGPASFHDGDQPPRIAENYYLQIGQEYGWLGLGLFVTLSVLVGHELYVRRHEPLALALFAAFAGLTIANLLLHAWADDTLAYIFWGMTGLALARSGRPKHETAT